MLATGPTVSVKESLHPRVAIAHLEGAISLKIKGSRDYAKLTLRPS